ncbi:MAG: Glu-tRNA(Gln) amidotransferase subunit GatE [Candidatus Aenigmatarchaeota archaeon]
MYREIGLKIGIEIHQRLATKTKLFCKCPAELDRRSGINPAELDRRSGINPSEFGEAEPVFTFTRKLRPTASEIGKVDRAAMEEFLKGREFVYQSYPNCCSVETDSDFPKEINPEALEIALQFAKMLKMQVPDVLQVMRKIVIDGSNTSGYQRTAFVAMGTENSVIETEYGPVRMAEMQLEEESATKAGEDEKSVTYRLDRLGIPLIEISSKADIWHPRQAKEFSEKLGLLLRSLKVQRGIGTIRQDINISIKGGARIEVKGFQDIKILDKVVENEVARQKDLIRIKGLLKGKKAEFTQADLTEIANTSGSKLLRKLSERTVLGLNVSGFEGMFKEPCGKITLGKEIANYARVFGIGGILHSDEEFSKYGVDAEEYEKIKKALKNKKGDLFLIIGGKNCEAALELIKKRIACLQKGVPEETRFVDGENTRYARELPGSARMYPEPDLPKVPVKSLLETVKVPKTLGEKGAEFEKLGLNPAVAFQIAKSRHLADFEEYAKKYRVEPKIIADLLLNTKKALERDGKAVPMCNVEFALSALSERKISKKAIEDVLVSGKINGLELITGKALERLATEFKKRHGEKAAQEIMKSYGKRVESAEVFKLLKKC